MDWLRRNWPDLAIGLALVGVIAGIVATLITGGSFFPATTSTGVPPAATAPADPATGADPAPASDLDAADLDEDPAPAPLGSVSVLTPDGQATEPDVPATSTPTAADPIPAADAAADAPEPNEVTPVETSAVATPAPVETPVAAAPTTPAATPQAPDAALPDAAGDVEAPYRVSVGAFGNPDNAARHAATFRDAGYPVFLGVQGALTIVLVGPYDAEAEALQVADRITAGDFGIEPVVYRFRPDAPTPGASTPSPAAADPAVTTPATTTPAATTPAATTPAATTSAVASPAPEPAQADATGPITTSSTGRSLQVGAFADSASAAPLRERLASVGLVAFEVRENGLTKLIVGPFDEDGLATARARLADQGIESFAR